MGGATFTILLRDLVYDGWTPPLRDYPIYDEAYREHLNNKILNHYMMWEIGSETVEMFEWYLKVKMGEIMPLYNKYYLSERLTFDPMKTMSYTEVLNANLTGVTDASETSANDNTTDSETNSASKARAVSSATPQTRLAGNMDYADGINDSTSSGDTTTHGTANSTGTQTANQNSNQDTNSTRGLQGYSGKSASRLMMEYRAQLLNIDMMVINDLESLFMGVFTNGDSMFDTMLPGMPMFGVTFGQMTSFPNYI